MLGAWVPGASAAVVRRQAPSGVPAGTGVLPGAWVGTRLRCRCYTQRNKGSSQVPLMVFCLPNGFKLQIVPH